MKLKMLFIFMVSVLTITMYISGVEGLEFDPLVEDKIIDGKNAKKITFPNLKTEKDLTDTELLLTDYVGKAKVKLKIKKLVEKQRIKDYYDCDCKDVIINNETGETIKKCNRCPNYEFYFVDKLVDLNPLTDKLKKDSEIYEVFEGCEKIGNMNNGWGCSSWSDLKIAGIEIAGATWLNLTFPYRSEIYDSNVSLEMVVSLNGTYGINGDIIWYLHNTTHTQYIYYMVSGYKGDIMIGTEYDQSPWENATSRTGYNITDLFDIGTWHHDNDTGNITFDSSSNARNGIMDIPWVDWNTTDSIYGNSIFNDGTTDREITFSDHADYDCVSNCTWETFVKFNDVNHTDHQFIMSKSTGGDWNKLRWELAVRLNEDVITCQTKELGSNDFFGIKSDTRLINNVWYHLVCSFEEGVFSMYLDGKDEGTLFGTPSATMETNNEPVKIMGEGRNAQEFYGNVDETNMYSDIKNQTWAEIQYNNSINILMGLGSETEQPCLCNATFNITDYLNGSNLDNLNISCGVFNGTNLTTPFYNIFECGEYYCNLTKEGYDNASLFVNCSVDNFTFNLSMNETIIPIIVIGIGNVSFVFDMDNAYTIGSCIDSDTLYRLTNKTSCVNNSCLNAYEYQYVNCPFGCRENITVLGDECFYPDYQTYVIIIIIVILIFVGITFLSKR